MWKVLLLAALAAAPSTALSLGPQVPEGLAPLDTGSAPWEILLGVAATVAHASAPDLDALGVGSLRDEVHAWYALAGAAPTPAGEAALDAGLDGLPGPVQDATALVLAGMNRAAALRAEAFATVSPDEIAWAGRAARADALGAQDSARLASILSRIDLHRVLEASTLVVAAIDAALPMLRDAAAAPGARDVSWVDPSGTLAVAGTADDVHAADRALLIDLGGDDWWANNAGATAPTAVIQAFPGCVTTGGLDCTVLHPKRNGPATRAVVGRACTFDLATPLFDADDYSGEANEEVAAQAGNPDADAALAFATATTPAALQRAARDTEVNAGCLPQGPDDVGPWADDFVTRGTLTDADAHHVAVGIDVSGDDRIAPQRVFNFMNNGKNPSGCDTTELGEEGKLWARNVTAGSGFAGVGVMWDEAGSDVYGGRSITQGVGHVGGAGVLVDRGAGADSYEAIRFAQGMAFAAGIALLYDDGGDDQYRMQNLVPLWNEFETFNGCDVSTRDGQGRSNILAAGALVDGGGDDVYFVQDHVAEGLLLPGAARDDATTTQGSTGFRMNIGPSAGNELLAAGRGLLWDAGGTDVYSRPGRGDDCFSSGGTFLDHGAAPQSALGPC